MIPHINKAIDLHWQLKKIKLENGVSNRSRSLRYVFVGGKFESISKSLNTKSDGFSFANAKSRKANVATFVANCGLIAPHTTSRTRK